jgi:hypothetical protein
MVVGVHASTRQGFAELRAMALKAHGRPVEDERFPLLQIRCSQPETAPGSGLLAKNFQNLCQAVFGGFLARTSVLSDASPHKSQG